MSLAHYVETLNLLGDENRIRLCALIRERELCVCELCDALELTQSTASTHLQIIRDAGWVRTRKEGKWIYYAMEPARRPGLESIFQLFDAELRHDARLRRDSKRLQQRLAEREDGACCRGFENTCWPAKANRKRRA